eukprot:jgi/Mesvir1/27873/Mv20060-RA.1
MWAVNALAVKEVPVLHARDEATCSLRSFLTANDIANCVVPIGLVLVGIKLLQKLSKGGARPTVDNFNTQGRVTGFGNPDFEKANKVSSSHAAAVKALLAAGARGTGIAVMDEMAFSIMGENKHFGTPINPAAKGRIPGGSSCGSAVAVAAGLCDFALGTDTCGSVRAPAACCGIYSLRPTHGAISVDGVIGMAKSFDTVGWFARDAALLKKVGLVLLRVPESGASRPRKPTRILIPEDAFAICDEGVGKMLQEGATAAAAKWLGAQGVTTIKLADLLNKSVPSLSHFADKADPSVFSTLRKAMAAVQGRELWQLHGAFVSEHKPLLAPDIQARLDLAGGVTEEAYARGKQVMDELHKMFLALLQQDAVLALPSIPSPPPKCKSARAVADAFRLRTMQLMALATMSGNPQVAFPVGTFGGLPLSLSLMGRAGNDLLLLDAALALPPLVSEAIAASSAKAAVKPSPAEEAKEKGNVAFKAGNYAEAVQHYTKALRLGGGDSGVYLSNRAMAHLKLGNFKEAEEDCTAALKLDKRNVKALLRRGTTHVFQGHYPEGIADFQAVLRLEPTNRTALDELKKLERLAALQQG